MRLRTASIIISLLIYRKIEITLLTRGVDGITLNSPYTINGVVMSKRTYEWEQP